LKNYNKLGFNRLSVEQQSKAKTKLSAPNIKVWSTFSKLVGVGNNHKFFMLTQILIVKRQAVRRFNIAAKSFLIATATKKKARCNKTTIHKTAKRLSRFG